jgi:hypothetical protein
MASTAVAKSWPECEGHINEHHIINSPTIISETTVREHVERRRIIFA